MASKDWKKTHTQLTAPGATAAVDMGRLRPSAGTVKITVAAIDANVVVVNQYSDDNFATFVQGEEKTITANGVYSTSLQVTRSKVRHVFSTESGGTAATVDFETVFSLLN